MVDHHRPPQMLAYPPRPPRRGSHRGWIVGGVAAVLILAPVMVVAALQSNGTHAGSEAAAAHTTKAAAKTRKASPAWPPQAIPVTKKELGTAWPFKAQTVNGFVGCDADHPGAIIFNPGSGPYLAKPFAINGTALDAGYPDIPKSIWLRDPAIPDPQSRMDISPLQDRAPNRCEK